MKRSIVYLLCLAAWTANAQTQAPVLRHFEPKQGSTGTGVLILGKNLKSTTKVRFGGVTATSFTVVSDTSIKAIVGSGASGKVQVYTAGGESSMESFTYIQQSVSAPSIARFEPKTGTLGTKVFIFGKNFKAVQYVMFGGVAAARFEIVNDSTILAVLGEGASGQVGVKSPGGQSLLGEFTYVKTVANPCDQIKSFQPIINEIKTDLFCFQDSLLKLRVSNGEFRSFRWSTGDTTPFVVIRGSQTVSVTVGNAALGCFSKPATVKFVQSSLRRSELVYKDSLLRVRPPASYYRWYFNGQLAGSDSILKATKIGSYRAETSNDKICWASTNEFKLTIGTLVSPADSLFMKLYPNPSTGAFTVAIILPTVRVAKISITISDASGVVVYKSPQMTMTGRELAIPLQLSRKGMYRVEAKVNEKLISKTLFIQ